MLELDTIRKAAWEGNTHDKYFGTWNEYMADCSARRVAPLPVTPQSILVFVIHKCIKQGNSVSASQWATHVKRYALTYHKQQFQPWSADDEADAAQVFKGLRKQIGYVCKQAPALTSANLRTIHSALTPDSCNLGPARQIWVAWVYVCLVQQAALRPIEACSGNLIVSDVSFLDPTADYPAGIELQLWGEGRNGTKGCKLRGKPPPEDVFIRQRDDELDVVRPLKQLYALYQLRRFPDRPLLTLPTEAGTLSNAAMSPTDLSALLVMLLDAAGVPNSQAYSARSCRAGRRTDLQDCNMAEDAVNMIGRWAATSSNRPYRRRTASIMALQPAGGPMSAAVPSHSADVRK